MRDALGEEKFNRFDVFAKERFGGRLPESYGNRVQPHAPNEH
jgi:hypothetical protein